MALAWWLVPCLPFPGLQHIYFLFTVRLKNEPVGVFLAWRSVHILFFFIWQCDVFGVFFLLEVVVMIFLWNNYLAILTFHLFVSVLMRNGFYTAICDQVCRWLVDLWFSQVLQELAEKLPKITTDTNTPYLTLAT